MHYSAFVLIPGTGEVDELVAEAMAPYDENRAIEQAADEDGCTYWHNPVGFWDWYQIGGRWTGLLSSYDPHTDPSLMEVCDLCVGTGRRNDTIGLQRRAVDPGYTCNGCDGKGKRQVWPTQFPRHAGDIQDALTALAAVTADNEKMPHSFIVHGSESVTHAERYVPDAPDGERFVDESAKMVPTIYKVIMARSAAGYVGDRIVVVDYHS